LIVVCVTVFFLRQQSKSHLVRGGTVLSLREGTVLLSSALSFSRRLPSVTVQRDRLSYAATRTHIMPAWTWLSHRVEYRTDSETVFFADHCWRIKTVILHYSRGSFSNAAAREHFVDRNSQPLEYLVVMAKGSIIALFSTFRGAFASWLTSLVCRIA
jgi:hypothetical protein